MKRFSRLKYKLAPQTKIYDSMRAKWRPFIMFNQFSNFRSKVCNTDMYGLRYNSIKHAKKQSVIDTIKEGKKVGLILGNSMAFGEGATSDETTISSFLSKFSNYHFLNFCGRGFSGLQEITNYLLLCHKINNLKKIIVISGLNDSFLPFHINQNKNDRYLTAIHGYKLFDKNMENQSLGWKKRILKNMFLLNEKTKKEKLLKFSNSRKKKILSEIIKRNFQLLNLISNKSKIDITFVLQPVGSWCKKSRSIEEKALFKEENQNPYLKNLYSYVNKKNYLIMRKLILRETKKYKIKFFDSNDFLDQKKFDRKWFFVSNFHVNDECNKIISNELKERFLK